MSAYSDPQPASGQSDENGTFLAQARRYEESWWQSLRCLDSRHHTTWEPAVRREWPTTQQRCLARVLRALLREDLLPGDAESDGDFVLRLPRTRVELQVSGFAGSRIMLLSSVNSIAASLADGNCVAVEHPAELLAFACAEAGDDPEEWQRLAIELSDSALNETLAQVAIARLNDEILHQVSASTGGSWARSLAQDKSKDGVALLLEQWAAIGHPLHIVPKARMGALPEPAFEMCPEFRSTLRVRLAALHRDAASVELPSGTASCESYFEGAFAQWLSEWRDALRDRGLDPESYVPFPIHPWNADNVLAQRCNALSAPNEVALLDGPVIDTGPTLSVRSVVPLDLIGAPTMKLSLGLRLTSGTRSISPRSCHMGARVCGLLRQILDRDPQLHEQIDLLDEELGLHYDGTDRELASSGLMGFIARRSVSRQLSDAEFAATAAALPLESPVSGTPLLLEIAALGNCNTVVEVFTEYVRAFLSPVLRFWMVYGIALEAHGQNVLAVFDKRGVLHRFLLRDFGGIRIHEPSLAKHNLTLDVHPDRRTVVQDFEDHRFWLMHRAYQCHIGHLAYMLSLHSYLSEGEYWALAGNVTRSIMDALSAEVEPERITLERRLLLEEPWEGKASLRMRLSNQVRDIPRTMRNPLQGW